MPRCIFWLGSASLIIRCPSSSSLVFEFWRQRAYFHFPFFFQDAKVMSWWDYGYQITAMANRTILVDNNTWNNTHISRVGQVKWRGVIWVFGTQDLVGNISLWGIIWLGILLWEMCIYFSRQWRPQKKKPMRSWGSLM